jgi:mRNA interferase YafQ
MLRPDYSSAFRRDIKRLQRKHANTTPLKEVIQLALENTPESLQELKQHHNMHTLKGEWLGSFECHVANAGDWLLVWRAGNGIAFFQRTGSHNEIFR